MSELEILLDGVEVEWTTLDAIATITIGDFVRKDIQNDSAAFPVYNGGITPTGYYNKFNNTGNKIIVSARGANAGFVNRISTEYWAGNSCYSVGVKDVNKVNWIYIYYYLKCYEEKMIGSQQKGGIPAISKKQMQLFKIPIPSLAIQKEIVRILDTFTELTVELTAALRTELTARIKQYNYYREQLLTFEGRAVDWKPLSEVAVIGTGRHDTKDAIDDGDYIFYARGKEPLKLDSYDFEETAIITAGDGAGVGKVYHWVTGKYALHQRAYRIVPHTDVNARFIYHYILANFSFYLEKASVSSSVTSLRRPMFMKFTIAIPPLEEQERIVNILDTFEALTTSMSEELHKEIALRKKQYEYYRNKLLTFSKDT